MIRRFAAGAFAAALALGFLVATASAQDRIDSGEWAGSRVDRPAPVTADPGSTLVQGVFTRDRPYGQPTVTMTITPPPLDPSCPHGSPRSMQMTVTPESSSGIGTSSYGFSWNVPFGPRVCNGTYAVGIVADVVGPDPSLTTVIDVAAPPMTVLGVTSEEVEDRVVEVSWAAPADPPPDLLGYTVVRASSTDETRFAVDDPAATSFVDDALPPEGGTLRYQVLARRSSPLGEVSSSGGEAAQPVTVEPAPATDEPDAGAEAGGGTGGSSGGGSDGATAPNPNRASTAPRVRVPLVGSAGTGLVPPLARPSPPTTVDDGFSETLPFDDPEVGPADAVPPDDELASAYYEGEAGRGLAVPIATALVLAVWAFHLRFLSKAARPAG